MIQEGQVLNGRYRLVRPLGRGSQAAVWVAEHLALKSQVAVKLIDSDLAKQEDARARFQREATAAAKLRSAHVVQILDHGIDGEQPFIVMELLDGEDLFQRLDRLQRLSLQETSRIVTHVARALTRAHAEGIIHRDLKPENVFIAPNEDEEIIKVLDFGVAKVTTPNKSVMSKTGAGTLIGTPHYMSPEQVKGIGEIDFRSDLWSLGVIAYQTITGALPFDSEGVGDLLIKISMDAPKKPSSLVADIPTEFDAWFERASAKDPDKRFQTARELADSLARVAGLEPRSSLRRGAPIANDLDWSAEFTNGGGGDANGMEVISVSGKTPSAREVLALGSRASAKPSDEIDVVEGSIPPPPPEPKSTNGASASSPSIPRPPRPPSKTQPSGPASAGAPMWETHGAPASNRVSTQPLASTVTGLASNSPSIAPPPELDGSGKRRTLWVLGIAFAVGAVALAVTVIRSQIGDGSPAVQATAESKPAASAPPSSAPVTTAPATSSIAMDPEVSKKPSASPSTAPPPIHAPPLQLPTGATRNSNGEVEVWIPLPDRPR
ncbi:MAG: serine/threonine-protein kinase [Polyangiaceae bacterium]